MKPGLFTPRVGASSAPVAAGLLAALHSQPLPKLTVLKNVAGACPFIKPTEMSSDEDDGLTLIICVEGRGDLVLGDQMVSLIAGQALLLPHDRHGGTALRKDMVTLSIHLDRDTATDIFPALDEAILRPTRPGDPTIKLLTAYCEQLLSSDAIPAPLALLCSAQIRELMAHLFDPAGELARTAPFGGIKAARLRSVLQEIGRRFRDPQLGAAEVGSQLGLTGRYVQQLLDGVGLSFSEHVRNTRIDEAKRMLRDLRYAHQRICDIAFAVGFRDLSYFNREFRRRTGETPSQARRRA